MTMTTVIILAAGKQVRNKSGIPKQLFEFNGETLLQRMVRQFSGPSMDIRLMAWDERLKTDGARFHVPYGRRWTVETLFCSQPFWTTASYTHRNIVLLGDVYYSDLTAEAILSNPSPFVCYQREHETYAFVFSKHYEWEVSDMLRDMIQKAERGKRWTQHKLGTLCKRLGVPSVTVSDETQDFDTYEDYEQAKLSLPVR